MTAHYHGTPITPRSVLNTLHGHYFCVSFAQAQDVERCHEIGAGVMLDNGAFSVWRRGIEADWPGFYAWAGLWLDRSPSTWAVIPDVIDGDEAANDALIAQWPHGLRGAPVWHMHESIGRLVALCASWPRVCIGSSGDYKVVGTARWHERMREAMNVLCGDRPPPCALHMLRGMAVSGLGYPFASDDSTDIAQNHSRKTRSALTMAKHWDGRRNPPTWRRRPIHAGDLFEARP